MFLFIFLFIAAWLALIISAFYTSDSLRGLKSGAIVTAFLTCIFSLAATMSAEQRLIVTTIMLLYVMKTIILLKYKKSEIKEFSKAGLFLYMSFWPGMDPEPFKKRTEVIESGSRFTRGFCCMVAGCFLSILIALSLPYVPLYLVPWLQLVSALLVIHFGYAEILTCIVRMSGWDVKPLFNDVFKSSSLREFWSNRWNHAFVEMDKILFWRPLKRIAGVSGAAFLIFVISGFLHELAISYAAFAGWGGPLVYFVIQAIAYLIESKHLKPENTNPWFQKIWTYSIILLPLPLLFTQPFQQSYMVPLAEFVRNQVLSRSVNDWFSLALYFAAIGNFVTMAAGGQAPARLGWFDDFKKLKRFNQKIFWNYYGYIGLMVFTWGTLSLYLHKELLAGDKAALCLALVMGVFWGLRVLVDFFYFKHDDWPKGAEMVIGHTMLTGLFCALTATYLGLVLWHFI